MGKAVASAGARGKGRTEDAAARENRVLRVFRARPLLTALGMAIRKIEPGCVVIRMPCSGRLLEGAGGAAADLMELDPGAIVALGDAAGNLTVTSLAEDHIAVRLLELKSNFMLPHTQATTLEAIGTVVRLGRSLSSVRVVIEAIGGAVSDERGQAVKDEPVRVALLQGTYLMERSGT